jgi:hypothetical protein
MALPQHFCWSRYGTEAGEEIDAILSRKEIERVANGGIFLWGIGSAIAPSLRRLLHFDSAPCVIFSPIRSAARRVDVAPNAVVKWTAGTTLDGQRYELPSASLVTSRAKGSTRRNRHYALVCGSTSKLEIGLEGEVILLGEVRNLLTDRPVGASQVTAVVRHSKTRVLYSKLSYPAAFQAQLVFPFFIELTGEICISMASMKNEP